MEPFNRLSTSEQLAEHLRRQIEIGRLSGLMPGVQQMVKIFGVNSVAVGKAVQQLENESLLLYQGDRKSRVIVNDAIRIPDSLRIGMLFYESTDELRFDVLAVRQELLRMGHTVFSCPKSMQELGRDVDRIRMQVSKLEADAWLVFAGSVPVLKWFEKQGKPTFALYGRFNQANLASMAICKTPVISTLIEKLVGLGHRRIVLLTREERRKPMLGQFERTFLDELEKHGIKTGKFNIPDWEDTPEGLENVIRSLFRITPPTAVLVGDSTLFHAIQLHLASKGVFAPRDVSLFCNDFELSFRWTRPEISHIWWDHRPIVRRIANWAKNVAHGKEDTRKSFIKAHLREGGTIGPVMSGKVKG
jgi:DNA-binding LacI/PurR family transcriptional regulator